MGIRVAAMPVGRLKWSMRSHQALWGTLFALPAVVYFSIFWIYPLLNGFYTSFTNWDLLSVSQFIGLTNYIQLVGDANFQQSVVATVYYAIGSSIPIALISLGLALLVNGQFRGNGFFRTAFFLPAVMSWIAASIVWRLIYMPSTGLYLLLVQPFGINEIKWLTSREWAMPAIIILAVWKSVGPNMILFLAGLQNLSEEIFEAARVDGANGRQVLWYITLPLLKPTTFFVLVILMIGAFQAFTPVYVLTRGGPANVTRVLSMLLYQEGFAFYHMGRAAAISVIMFAAIFSLTLLQMRAFRGDVTE